MRRSRGWRQAGGSNDLKADIVDANGAKLGSAKLSFDGVPVGVDKQDGQVAVVVAVAVAGDRDVLAEVAAGRGERGGAQAERVK